MYCSQCGKKLSSGARYCPGCGARQEMGIVPAGNTSSGKSLDKERKKQEAYRRGRRLGNFLVSMIALLILFTGEKAVPEAVFDAERPMDAAWFTAQNQREMAVCNEKGLVCTIDLPQRILYSGNHEQMAYVDRDGELYYMEDTAPVFVDDRVSAAEWSFHGDSIVYVREGEDGRGELHIYKIRSQSSDYAAVAGCREFTVSPDGRTVACVETDGTLLLWHFGGQAEKISANVSEVFALSDGGKTMFYRKGGDGLFLYAGGGEKKTASISGNVSFVLNESQTEMLYSENGNTWYSPADLEAPVRLAGVKGEVLTSCYMADLAYQQGRGLVLGRETLKDMTFAVRDPNNSSYKIYHLDERGENADAVLNHADQFQISENGRSLVWLSGRKLYRMKNIRNSQEKICLSDDMDVCQFAADSRLTKIWFATTGRELYYVKKKECVNLSGDLTQLFGFCMDGILFQEGQDLYAADGEEKILLKGAVEGVSVQENDYVIVDADGEFCYLKRPDEMISLMSSR